MNESRNIPEPIKREVRQRCGFGCVICGFPIYEYEHMEEWAKVKRHVASEITLLCNNHHREKTYGLLPKADVINANRNPYNIRNGISSPYNLKFSGSMGIIKLGSLGMTNSDDIKHPTQLVPFLIYDTPIIYMNIVNKQLFLNANIFDEFDRLILKIKDNELVHVAFAYDITFIGTTLTIRKALGIIILEINFKPPSEVVISRALLQYKGVKLTSNNIRFTIKTKTNTKGFSIEGITWKFPSTAVLIRVGDTKHTYITKDGETKEIPTVFYFD